MSNYNPTYTRQWRDYEAARKEKERTGYYKSAPLITEVRPNPLSMELRIVLNYFWETYKFCMNTANDYRERGEELGRGEEDIAKAEREAGEILCEVRNLCHELFAVTSPHAPFHIHSQYGCNDDTCPAWVQGYEAAKDDVHDWYTPDC